MDGDCRECWNGLVLGMVIVENVKMDGMGNMDGNCRECWNEWVLGIVIV